MIERKEIAIDPNTLLLTTNRDFTGRRRNPESGSIRHIHDL